MRHLFFTSAFLTALLLSTACRFGRVGQGQVVACQAAQSSLTLIEDSNYMDPANPRFDILPAVLLSTPQDPGEMGPAPTPGKLLRIDRDAHRLMVFDPASNSILAIPYTLLEQKPVRNPRASFPQIDPAHQTITIYSPRDHLLLTVSVPAPYWNLPPDTWRFGDEVRYYYKQPGRALRLMNVSQTDMSGSK